jgi:hypothetical protein
VTGAIEQSWGQGAGDAVPAMREAIAADFRSSSLGPRVALVGVCIWLAYEWGPGNETVTPWVLVRVIGDNEGARTILFTAAVGFLFTAAQQLASGFTALLGFSMFERSARASWQRLAKGTGVAPTEWAQLGWLARSALVFGLGTTAVALIEIMSTGETGVGKHARVVGTSALLCGLLVGAIGAVGAGLALLGRSVESMRDGTDWVLRTLGNPLLWTGLVAVILIRQAILARHDRDDRACPQP